MKKRILSFLLLGVLLLQFCACKKDGVGKRVIFPIDTEPAYLDPQIAATPAERNVVANCFEGLMGYDSSGALVPAAAESYDVSADGLTYTFHLRSGLAWLLTDGARGVLGDAAESFDTRLTSADFAFGLRRALLPETASPAARLLFSIQNAEAVFSGAMAPEALGIDTPDAATLVLRLHRTDGGLLETLTEPGCMPCNEAFFTATGGRYGLTAAYLLYNGPFYIGLWSEGTAITVRRNESYRAAGSVKPASVYFSINNDVATRAEKVKDGTYEVSPVTPAQAAALAGEKDVSIHMFPNATYGLLLNCADENLQSALLRKAIARAMDPAPLLEAKGAVPAAGILPQSCTFGGQAYRDAAGPAALLATDRDKAKADFDSGMKKLNLAELAVTVLCTQDDEMAVRAIMQQWQSAFGVTFSCSVEVLSGIDLEARLLAGEYQLAFAPLKFAAVPAVSAIRLFMSENAAQDPLHLTGKKIDARIDAVGTGAAETDCLAALQQTEQALLNAAVFVPICAAKTNIATAKGVDGAVASPSGDRVWFCNVTVTK